MLRKVIRVLSVKSVAFEFVACQKNNMLPVSKTEFSIGDFLCGLCV